MSEYGKAVEKMIFSYIPVIETAFSLLLLNMRLVLWFLIEVLYQVKEVPFYSYFLRDFIMTEH